MTALKKTTDIETALPDLADGHDAKPPLGRLADVPVKVSAVLGKTRLNVADLMAMEDGAVIELDRKVGEPIDLYVNDTLFARGELVMIDGSVGVTLTELVGEKK